MKKILFALLATLGCVGGFAQNDTKVELPDAVKNANAPLSEAQKAAMTWVKDYDLSPEQAKEAYKIQLTKFSNLEGLKATQTQDPAGYAESCRLAVEMAEAEMTLFLDGRQRALQQKKYVDWLARYESAKAGLVKQGASAETMARELYPLLF